MRVELNAASAFSFLRASSLPEELVARAAELELTTLALVDRDGLSGAPRFFQAAKAAGIRPVVGAQVTLAGGGSLPLLVETRTGYRNLCRLLTAMKRGVPKGEGALRIESLTDEKVEGLVALPGIGTLGASPSTERLARLLAVFGAPNVAIDVQRHRRRAQEAANQALLQIADALGLDAIATNGVRHARAPRRALLDVLTCIREKRTLADGGRLLADNAERHLKSPKQMAALFADRPGLVRNAEALADRLRFTLEDLPYEFPDYPLGPGETMFSILRAETEKGARKHYGPHHERAWRQIERELALIGKLKLEGYFLIVWDIVNFCREKGILAQGRGSAANSAVCYSLGITAVDPVGMDLLFERFLSEERKEWPDIDLDLPSGDRREEVIQHVYRKYGETGAGMTAVVITYREKSAAREIGKVLDIPPAEIDRLARTLRPFEYIDPTDSVQRKLVENGFDWSDRRVQLFARLIGEIRDLPRHLGQHTGGMVIAKGRLDDVVPLEPASMPGRVVIQWDKDDVSDLHLIKIDLLGLGMMAALQDTLSLLKGTGVEVDLAHLPADDPKVYGMLQKADTVGVFQVESRAQMATLPRLKPDALLRPRGRGRDHPAGADRGEHGPSLPAPARGPRARDLRAPEAGADPRPHAGRAALPGAAPAHGHGRRELHGRRGGGAAARDGHEALAEEDGRARGEAAVGHEGERHRGRRRRPDRPVDHVLRAVRLPGIARGQLRAARLRERVPARPSSGRVRVRAAQQPAHGVLLAVHSGQGRAAARRAVQARRRDEERLAVHARGRRGAPGPALRARPAPGGGGVDRLGAAVAAARVRAGHGGPHGRPSRRAAAPGGDGGAQRVRAHAAERAMAGREGGEAEGGVVRASR